MALDMKSDDSAENAVHESLTTLYFCELGLKDYEKRIRKRLDRKMGRSLAAKIRSHYDVRGKRILDVGSGFGEVCIELAKLGGILTGVEPDVERLLISRRLASKENVTVDFLEGFAEELPFPDGHFDMVISNATIEHVKCVRKSVSEMVRVAKPDGGIIYINAPNYLFPYENHYKVLYPPLAPKMLMRLYLRMIGRKPDFMQHINYTTTPKIVWMLKGHGLKLTMGMTGRMRTKRGLLGGLYCYVACLAEFALKKSMLHPNIDIFAVKDRHE